MKSSNIEMESRKKKKETTMLEYYKLLLSKVSFNKKLLHKEYQKGLKYLSLEEQAELNWWMNFNKKNNWLVKR